ncbi:MAG: family 43 glycosylhydrolase, partial [Caldilineaceae bacterium]|nr:family 43 glycosylhydrolase [Caldilineaceae bacterium]
MYHHPGEYVTDFCIVKRDNLYHLFHIRGERWTWPVGYRELDLGHATSTDLRTWTPHAPVLPAGPVGAWDECGNWAPDIIEVDGIYYCYYTGSDTNN